MDNKNFRQVSGMTRKSILNLTTLDLIERVDHLEQQAEYQITSLGRKWLKEHRTYIETHYPEWPGLWSESIYTQPSNPQPSSLAQRVSHEHLPLDTKSTIAGGSENHRKTRCTHPEEFIGPSVLFADKIFCYSCNRYIATQS